MDEMLKQSHHLFWCQKGKLLKGSGCCFCPKGQALVRQHVPGQLCHTGHNNQFNWIYPGHLQSDGGGGLFPSCFNNRMLDAT